MATNLEFIYDSYVYNIGSTNTVLDYHPEQFLYDWMPASITYWKSTQTTDDLVLTLTSSMQVNGKYIIIEGDNWDSFDLQDDATTGTPSNISYTETTQDNFRILEITGSFTGTAIYLNNIDAGTDDVEAGQIIVCDTVELDENPRSPWSNPRKPFETSSFRSIKGNLVKYTVGRYDTYTFEFEYIDSATLTQLENIYNTLVEHPVLMNLGEIDSDWRWVGTAGGVELPREKLISDYYNVTLELEDLEGEA